MEYLLFQSIWRAWNKVNIFREMMGRLEQSRVTSEEFVSDATVVDEINLTIIGNDFVLFIIREWMVTACLNQNGKNKRHQGT